MGQVPGLVYGIVGDGRLARHFAHYLTLESIPFQQWSRRIGEHERVSAEARLAPADVLLVLLRDNAIETWIERHPELRGRPIVHCSGSLVTELAVGFHPLMTFGPELYDLETYRSIPFICEAKQGSFQEFFPRLQNPHHLIQPELKSLYHSLCVMSGNFTTILWQKFFHDLEHRLGLP
ncbi:MAG: hypothetical protein ACXWP5_08765, partial [Bdellovibrionota bacterium]